MTQKTNRLAQSTSPYLLQHAHNPVDWFEWGDEALQKAKQEDKPILVSIGYSSCHWCHVMERESFEKEDVAEVMNAHFICIKVDREERPDVDQIYMDAVQALGIHGGWPLNVFLTPEQKPFFGGTYFSPVAWVQVLTNINKAFEVNRTQIEGTAEELRLHLLRSDVVKFKKQNDNREHELAVIYQKLADKFDKIWGGLDRAPKFVMPSIWHWMLRFHYLSGHEEAKAHTLHTLKKIAMGGIYDQVGGGFARYSVDGQWFAPHFEKMLYDNAQLMSLYSEAYMLTQDEEFKMVVYETFGWLTREMTSDQGGFYSALDADSEGEEGKFYTWSYHEILNLLGDDGLLMASYYGVKETGNWEHGDNILIRLQPDDVFLQSKNITALEWSKKLLRVKQVLLQHRETRIRPGLDDKIITSWNAMMVCGLVDAYRAFQDDQFLNSAVRNLNFLKTELKEQHTLYRSFKMHRSKTTGFLDDYAYYIQACIKVYQVTFDEVWLHEAKEVLEYTLTHLYDPAEGFFFYAEESGLITRKKEIFDNVIPSSNAVMAQNLFHAGILWDKDDWKDKATTIVNSISHIIHSEPNYMSHWAIVVGEIHKGLAEVVMVGNSVHDVRKEFQNRYHPLSLSLGTKESSNLPLISGKKVIDGQNTIYVCRDKTCKRPVNTVAEAEKMILE